MAQVDWYIEGVEFSNCMEYDIAEIGSGTTKKMASIALDLKDTYCHFTRLRQSSKGVVRLVLDLENETD